MGVLIVAEHIKQRCCAKTLTTVPMFKKALRMYHDDPTVDGDETKHLLVHCDHYVMEIGCCLKI